MSNALLTTKLYFPPPRPSLVPRPRLVERLQAGLQTPLTLISAQAGSGKTTLISQWRNGPGSGTPTSWLSLDPADNDPRRFLQYLSAALDILEPGLEEEVRPLLQAAEPPNGEAVLTLLINRLSGLEEDAVLALDDFHLIDNPSIHTALTFLLEHLPPHLHLVLLTRADPPLPLARLRACGQMVEIRSADLRFSVEECAQFLNQTMGLGLSGEQVAALEKRTEGWIAGLQLAALSMRGREDVDGFVSAFTGSNYYIMNYLVEEVLGHQPEALRQFLLKTSILERFTGSLCDVLTGDKNGEEILQRLDDANLFLIPLDDERRWHRYHHLFEELLRTHLEKAYPDQVAILHQKASTWYEEQDLLVEAVRHALAAHDVNRATQLAEKSALGMMEHGNLGLLVEWLDALPSEAVHSRPWLCIARAWALAYTGAYEAAKICLQDAAKALECGSTAPDECAHIQGHIHTIYCYVLGLSHEDYKLAIEHGKSAMAQLPEWDWRSRGRAAVMLGIAYRLDMAYPEAYEALSQALQIAKKAKQGFVVVDVLCQIARLEREQGRLHQSMATCREALHQADEFSGKGHAYIPVVSNALITRSYILLEWNKLDAALDCAQEALSLSQQWGKMDSLSEAYWILIYVRIARREFTHALDTIYERARSPNLPWIYQQGAIVMEALTRLAMDELEAASQLARTISDNTDRDRRMELLMPVYLAEFRHGLRSSLDDVFEFLDRSLKIAEEAGSQIFLVEFYAWQAMAYQAVHQAEQASVSLTRALTLAEPEGYIRTFINLGPPMKELLAMILVTFQTRKDAPSRKITDYILRLLPMLDSKQPSSVSPAPLSSFLVEALSARELQVLKLLAEGLADKQIAETLVIARETVHKHLKNIYEKLNVHSRTAAVARGRELKLL